MFTFHQGLTPAIFWAHKEEILAANRSQLPILVAEMVSQHSSSSLVKHTRTPPSPVMKVGGRLLLSALEDIPPTSSVNDVGERDICYLVLTSESLSSTSSLCHLSVISGKRGQSHFLQYILPASVDFIRRKLYNGQTVCVAGDSGKDLPVGVVLTALALFFNDDGLLKPFSEDLDVVASELLLLFIHRRIY